MSGIEVAGLVLGAIPIVITGLEKYIQGVATVKRYFRYKNELKSLLRALSTEYDIFRNSCEELLEGLVPVQRLSFLLQDPGGKPWKDASLEKRLKQRLQDAYKGYLETVDDMEAAVEEFKDRLKLKDGKVQFDDIGTFKQEYKRLKFSLSKSSYDDLMVRIRQDNQTLGQLTKQSLRLEPSRVRRHRRVPDFNGVRDSAKSVYTTLRSGWRCGCQSSHTANLRLESRTDIESDSEDDDQASSLPRFRIIFSFDHSNSNDTRTAATPWSWEEADICTIRAPETQATIHGPPKNMALQRGKGVRFQESARFAVTKALDKQPDLNPIADLCMTMKGLQSSQRQECLGLLIDELTRQKHGIFPPKKPCIRKGSWSTLSLQNLIPQSPTVERRFTRADKLRLAVILSSSVLQLHETPWLNETWQKGDIMFIDTIDGPLYSHPFVAKNFHFTKPSTQLRVYNTTANIHRAIRNPILFALGVLLIELCLSKPMDELKRPEEKTSDGTTNPILDWLAADRLVQEVYVEGGSRYGDAVRHCIRCDFDKREFNLEDDEFQRAVYEGVVSLLEDDLKQFHGL